MPKVSAKCPYRVNKVPLQGKQSAKLSKLTNHYALITNHFKLKQGFSLIEIVLAIFVILAIVTIILTASSSYTTTRGSNLQGIATKIASRQMENLRNTAYDSLPSCASPGGCSLSDDDLTKLPNSTAKQFIDSYQSSADIKQATIQINWTTNGAPKQIKIETLIYKNGI